MNVDANPQQTINALYINKRPNDTLTVGEPLFFRPDMYSRSRLPEGNIYTLREINYELKTKECADQKEIDKYFRSITFIGLLAMNANEERKPITVTVQRSFDNAVDYWPSATNDQALYLTTLFYADGNKIRCSIEPVHIDRYALFRRDQYCQRGFRGTYWRVGIPMMKEIIGKSFQISKELTCLTGDKDRDKAITCKFPTTKIFIEMYSWII
jgi:hypothetical protein